MVNCCECHSNQSPSMGMSMCSRKTLQTRPIHCISPLPTWAPNVATNLVNNDYVKHKLLAPVDSFFNTHRNSCHHFSKDT